MRQNPHLAALDMERLLTVSRATRPLGLPDGGVAYASNAVGHSQVYRVSGPGDEPKRLVQTDDRVIPHVWTRHGLVVRHDNGGDETWQLSLLGDEGRMRQLSFDPEAIHTDPRLRPDGDALGLSWNPGGQSDMVLGELLLPSGELAHLPGGTIRTGSDVSSAKLFSSRSSSTQSSFSSSFVARFGSVMPSTESTSISPSIEIAPSSSSAGAAP